MANLKIQTTLDISVPNGVKIISNGDWITLAKKEVRRGTVSVFTCLKSEIVNIDLNEPKNWTSLSKDELAKISKM